MEPSSLNIDFYHVARKNSPLVEIGKNTMDKMMLRMTPDGKVNQKDEIILIGQGDDEKAQSILQAKLATQVESEKKKAKAPIQWHPTRKPRTEKSPSPTDTSVVPIVVFAKLQDNVQEIKNTQSSLTRYLVKIEQTLLNLNCYNHVRPEPKESELHPPATSLQRERAHT